MNSLPPDLYVAAAGGHRQTGVGGDRGDREIGETGEGDRRDAGNRGHRETG